MKKRFALRIYLLLALLLPLFVMTACEDPVCQHRDADDNSLCDKCNESYTDGEDIHIHRYTEENTDAEYVAAAADCENAASYFYSCVCGEKGTETFYYGEPNGHSYTVESTDAEYFAADKDCEHGESYFYSCSCGKAGTDVFYRGEPKEHSYTVESTDAEYFAADRDCEHGTSYFYSCSCGKAGTDVFYRGEPKGHSYTVKSTDAQYFAADRDCEHGESYFYSCSCGKAGTDVFYRGKTAHEVGYVGDKDFHWVECEICKETVNYGEHEKGYYGVCTVCDESMHGPVAWAEKEPVNLVYKMTDYDANGTTPSGCRRYLAGEDTTFASSIDDAVAARNAYAERLVNVRVTYLYYENIDANGWGQTTNLMFLEVSSGGGVPDIFTNYTYDMVGTSLKGSFHNLKNTTLDIENGGNYFSFLKDGYNEEVDDKGYMYAYMQSLTLSDEKMYVLASDYYIDCIRSFFVVPVNVGLLESVGPKVFGTDTFTVDDFYELVWQKRWTYNMAAAFSTAVYKDTGTAIVGEDLDDVLGYVVTPNRGGSAFLYTTSVSIIDRRLDTYTEQYEYTYPYENEQLYGLFYAISDFMGRTGVTDISFSDPAIAKYGNGTGDVDGAVRTRFCQGKILFIGNAMLGSLEQDAYQTLKATEGFGLAPVPLYHEISEGSDETYRTLISSTGRTGAISRATKNFAAATAFLDYVSTHSSHILEEYYNYKFQYDIVDAEIKGNVEMLKYLRSNVGSALDMVWDDAMNQFYKQASGNKWSRFLEYNRYQYDVRESYYEQRMPKYVCLSELYKLYENLP